jgi:hypothetical protein
MRLVAPARLLALVMWAGLAPSPAAGTPLEARYLAARDANIEEIGRIQDPQDQALEA